MRVERGSDRLSRVKLKKLLNYVDPTITTRNYNNPAFFFNADSFTPAVPEPAGWALMLAGLGLFGALVNRRR